MPYTPILLSQTGTADIDGGAGVYTSIGSFSPDSDRLIGARIKLASGLSAVDSTFEVRLVDSGGLTMSSYGRPKEKTADAGAYLHFNREVFLVKSTETVHIEIRNGVDTGVDWEIEWLDGNAVDVTARANGAYKVADTTGNWATAGTWESGVVPSAGDNIIIRDGVVVTVAASLDLGQFGTQEVQGNGVLSIASGQTVAVVPRWWVIATNSGAITTNYGTVTANSGTITTNFGTITTNNTGKDITNNFGTITTNFGTITTNNTGTVTTNAGVVTTNSATITNNFGTITTNAGTVVYNNGTVTTNNSGSVVLYNYGTITNDNGNSDVPRVTLTDTATTNTDLTALTVNGLVKATVPPTAGQVGDDSFMFSITETAREGSVESEASQSTSDTPEDDRIKHTTTHVAATVGTQWNVAASVSQHDPAWTPEVGDPTIVFSSSDDAIQTIDQSGNTHYVSDGSVRFIGISAAIGTSPARTSYTDFLTSETSVDPSFDTVTYTDDVGSCRENANDAVDTRIAVGGKDKPIFTTQDPYLRSADCWAGDLDLTGISPYNSTGGTTRAGTLISPRHIVFAEHFPIAVGATIRFVKANGDVVTRTMTAREFPASDIAIGVLSADITELTDGITFYEVLPDGYLTQLPANFTNSGQMIGTLGLDKQERALVQDIANLDSSNMTTCQVPTDSTRLDFYEAKISGDSGNPCFMIVNDELVVLCCWWFGGAGSGPAIHEYKTEINAAMTSLGGGYQLTEVDLSGFNSY